MLVAFHVLCIIWIAVLFWFYTQIAHLASVNSGSASTFFSRYSKTLTHDQADSHPSEG
jgi:hypothetical protein